MKIRNSFVSNSSSTSFIIALNPKNRCPHCGRSSPNIIDIIGNHKEHCDDTGIDWDDPQEYIDKLEGDLLANQQEFKLYKQHQDDEIIRTRYNVAGYKVGDLRRWTKQAIDSLSTELLTIKKAVDEGKKLFGISISYHDEIFNNLLKEQIANGEVEVIKSED